LADPILEMAVNIVSANSSGRGFPVDVLSDMIEKLVCTIQSVDNRLKAAICIPQNQEPVTEAQSELTEESPPAIPVDWKKSIGIAKITCMICGYQGKALAGHLRARHNMDGKSYRKQFGIPARTSLTSKNLQKQRRETAKRLGTAENLKAAREAKKAGKV
jgi:predicted transcriptional regulator